MPLVCHCDEHVELGVLDAPTRRQEVARHPGTGEVRYVSTKKLLRNPCPTGYLGVRREPSHIEWAGWATSLFAKGEAVARCGRIEGNTSVSDTRPAARRLNLVTANSPLPAGNAEDRAWVSEGLCRDKDPDELFVRGAAQRRAAVICRHCPVMQQCATDALDNKVEYGVWGGMTERQRRALLKENPEVISWSDYFDKRAIRSIG